MKRNGSVFILLVTVLAVFVAVFPLTTTYEDAVDLLVRIFALEGFFMLSVAVIITPFLKEIKQSLGKSFLRVHHIFAVAGLILVTLHPVLLAIESLNAAIFLPNFRTWYLFWLLGGRQALIVIYIALAAVLLRKQMTRFWRVFHALMYVALFFAIVHGNLIGTNFENLAISLLFNGLFAVAILAFVLKRVRNWRIRTQLKTLKGS